MEVVKPYCAQWQDVRFDLPMSVHLQLNMSAFPRLQRLALIGPMRRRPGMMVPIVFRDAPLLRDVEISNLLYYVQVDIPFEQLTTFHFNTFRRNPDHCYLATVFEPPTSLLRKRRAACHGAR
jgi:hypothetical protein